MNKQHEKYSNAACPNCKQVGTKHGVYLCESYGDYQSDKCRVICLTRENEQLRDALTDMLSGWHYIRLTHGDLSGVNWELYQNNAVAALRGEMK